MSETTVRSIRDSYKEEVKRKRRDYSDHDELKHLKPKKRGRPLLLGQDMDAKVQLYIRKLEKEEELSHL